ncbi:MAG TPA: hypothetical protein VD866_25950 [Urbifossiella sp.]|nr:hypothetical protein [Urbifossiella sp.]
MGDFTPAQAKKFFEFFPTGSEREVLLLGDLVEAQVHWVKSFGHKVRCSASSGHCDLCIIVGEGNNEVGIRQTEYTAPAYVRPKRQKQFDQRVVVFSAATGERVLALLGEAGLQCRGQILNVKANKHGPRSCRYEVTHLASLPRETLAGLPAEFDVLPFVQARFGRPLPAGSPLVFLQPFKIERAVAAVVRPKLLPVRPEDSQYAIPADEERRKVQDLIARNRHKWAGGESPAPAAEPTSEPTSPAAPAATSPPTAPAAAPNHAPRASSRPGVRINQPAPDPTAEPDSIDGALDRVVNRFALGDDPMRVDGDIDHYVYGRKVQRGPKVAVYEPPSAEDEDAALHKRVGETTCDEQKERSPFLNKPGKNGTHTPAGKGGAK